MDEEIKRQKAEVPSDQEFESLMANQLEKGSPRIALFMVDKRYLKLLSASNSVYRFTQLLAFGYCCIYFTKFYTLNPHMATIMYSVTGLSVAFAIGARIFYRRVCHNFVVKIEFDLSKKCFVVTGPATSFLKFGTP